MPHNTAGGGAKAAHPTATVMCSVEKNQLLLCQINYLK